jgi:exonuclease VII small subunit
MYEIKQPEGEYDLVIAELLGVINKITESNNRLQAVIAEYQDMVNVYRHSVMTLKGERNRARSIAATLEAECAACWGPVHAETLHGIRKGVDYGA